MVKFHVEICLISARGLTRTSSLWKLQWFAVGWIDPNTKYCTKVDASGNTNPMWKTKFSVLTDESDSRFEDLTLSVEVYSRDPVFLKEKLQGTASVGLKEFVDKHKIKNSCEGLKNGEEVGSFQLRKRSSDKPQGFVDVSIRISQEVNVYEGSSYEDNEVGIKLRTHDHGVNSQANYSTPLQPGGQSYYQPQAAPPQNYGFIGGSNHQPHHGPLGPSHHQPLAQPPLPYNFGYMTSSSIDTTPLSYINMPSARPGPRAGPGFAMGLGAGALAAGATIFGEDLVSGFDLPTGFTISTDPPL